MRKILFILTLLTFGLCAAAFSDVIYLKSGGRVSGEIVNETEEEIKIETTIATITIMKDQIDEIEVEKGDEGAGQAEPEVVKPEIESKDTKELSFAEKIILARAPLKEKIHSLEQELETARASLPKEIEQAKAPLQEKIKSLEGELEKARVSVPKEIEQAKAPLQQEIDLLKKEREDLFAQQEKLSRELEKKTLALAEAYTPAVETPVAEAVEIDTEDAEAYYQQGLIYDKKAQYGQAIFYYTKALEIDPEYTIAYNNRGLAYRCRDQFDRAISNFNKAIEIDPNYAKAYNNRGVAYKSKGLYNQAIFDYTKALEIEPDYVDAYYNRGNAHCSKEQHYQAISDYNKAIEIDPAYVEAYFNKAIACDNVDRPKEALSTYRDFVQYASPDNHKSRIEYAKERIMILGN